MSPSASTSGWPGRVSSGPTETRPARSTSAPVASPSRLASEAAVTPCRPDHGSRRDALLALVRLHRDAVVIDVHDGVTEQRRDAEMLERVGRLLGKRGREGREHSVGHLEEQHPSGTRIHQAEVPAERVPGELSDLAGHLHPGRPGPDHHEGEPGPPALLVGLQLGGLEGAQDLSPHRECALERLHLVRVDLPLVVAEIGIARAACRDQRVVGDREWAGLAGARTRPRTVWPSRSSSFTSPSSTRTFRRRLKIARSG